MKFQIIASNYVDNNRIALGLLFQESDGSWQPYANLTVNLVNETIPLETEDIAYGFLDTNNYPDSEDFVTKHQLGEKTSFVGHSGYCTYPLYRFDKKRIQQLYRTNGILEG